MQVFILDRKRDRGKIVFLLFIFIFFFRGRGGVLGGFRESNVVFVKRESLLSPCIISGHYSWLQCCNIYRRLGMQKEIALYKK